MSDSPESVYSQYQGKPEYSDYHNTAGGFAIIAGHKVEGRPSILITQRNGNGGSKWLWNLPGGLQESEDGSLADTVARELRQELDVNVSPSEGVPIGDPLWLPIGKEGNIQRIDRAQAYLFEVTDQEFQRMDESIALAFAHQDSIFNGFRVVGLSTDPQKPVFGRTPIMMWDGLSILQEPFYEGPVTPLILSAGAVTESNAFVLLERGRYFGRYSKASEQVKLWYRLNPFEEQGRFHGELEKQLS
jgi:8-oxo-dGTP pyrophosphatase MutT (NUDIX family)